MAPRPFISMIRNQNFRCNRRRVDYPQDFVDDLFRPCVRMQERSPDIVVYDRSQRAVVEFGYPASLLTLEAIVPTGIIGYFERRRIALECFCELDSEEPVYLDMMNTRYGAVGSCHRCGCRVDFRNVYQTMTIAGHYEGFNRRSAIRPASAPIITLPRARLHNSRRISQPNRRGMGAAHNAHSASTMPSLWARQVTPTSFRTHLPSDDTFPTSPTEYAAANRRFHGKAAESAPSRFMSLSSPTSSQASGLIHYNSTAASSSGSYGHNATSSSSGGNGPDGPLEFCDSCFAAYPVADFPSHSCI
ncbi:hypothetical protein M422DRAFT_42988 [Sphaerobolus stellatus SS14]|nr:hypothetical protein M422DRAFT_42988 [Sphaerobolus stellatus SS14]